MLLASPVPNGQVTQYFGVTNTPALHLEPAMWAAGDKAYWVKYPGSGYYSHFHPGVDYGALPGIPIYAIEDSVVVASGWADSTSGYHIKLQIRPGTIYGFSHLIKAGLPVGTQVKKGQVVAQIGQTGKATGPHTHFYISVYEKGTDGIYRTFLYNPKVFMPGGKYQNDPRIQPVGAPVATWKGRARTTAPKPAGVADLTCNIRSAANALASSIWARTYGDGYTYQFINGVKGAKLWPNTSAYAFNGGYVGDYAQVKTGAGKILYIHKSILVITLAP